MRADALVIHASQVRRCTAAQRRAKQRRQEPRTKGSRTRRTMSTGAEQRARAGSKQQEARWRRRPRAATVEAP
eukprot:14865600-Alexandrium_andersonii.AAC.1